VNTGAFDPIGEVVARLRGTGAWIHVDAAFGLWAAAAPATRALADGIDLADSIATDAHKWLNVPYDNGLVFVRDRRALNAAMAVSAAYLIEGESRDPQMFVPEGSRRARAVDVWAALRSLGRRGLAELIERNCRQAGHFADELRKAGYQVLNDVVLNQVLVSFGTAERTRRVIAAIQQDGTCWCGGTSWQGTVAMRISVSSWATSDTDVAQSIDAILRCARDVQRSESEWP
jgi:glutamate/tyrosine decarboxylase-like PLP-dependent enzyme